MPIICTDNGSFNINKKLYETISKNNPEIILERVDMITVLLKKLQSKYNIDGTKEDLDKLKDVLSQYSSDERNEKLKHLDSFIDELAEKMSLESIEDNSDKTKDKIEKNIVSDMMKSTNGNISGSDNDNYNSAVDSYNEDIKRINFLKAKNDVLEMFMSQPEGSKFKIIFDEKQREELMKMINSAENSKELNEMVVKVTSIVNQKATDERFFNKIKKEQIDFRINQLKQTNEYDEKDLNFLRLKMESSRNLYDFLKLYQAFVDNYTSDGYVGKEEVNKRQFVNNIINELKHNKLIRYNDTDLEELKDQLYKTKDIEEIEKIVAWFIENYDEQGFVSDDRLDKKNIANDNDSKSVIDLGKPLIKGDVPTETTDNTFVKKGILGKIKDVLGKKDSKQIDDGNDGNDGNDDETNDTSIIIDKNFMSNVETIAPVVESLNELSSAIITRCKHIFTTSLGLQKDVANPVERNLKFLLGGYKINNLDTTTSIKYYMSATDEICSKGVANTIRQILISEHRPEFVNQMVSKGDTSINDNLNTLKEEIVSCCYLMTINNNMSNKVFRAIQLDDFLRSKFSISILSRQQVLDAEEKVITFIPKDMINHQRYIACVLVVRPVLNKLKQLKPSFDKFASAVKGIKAY